jgi:hypothetical protein
MELSRARALYDAIPRVPEALIVLANAVFQRKLGWEELLSRPVPPEQAPEWSRSWGIALRFAASENKPLVPILVDAALQLQSLGELSLAQCLPLLLDVASRGDASVSLGASTLARAALIHLPHDLDDDEFSALIQLVLRAALSHRPRDQPLSSPPEPTSAASAAAAAASSVLSRDDVAPVTSVEDDESLATTLATLLMILEDLVTQARDSDHGDVVLALLDIVEWFPPTVSIPAINTLLNCRVALGWRATEFSVAHERAVQRTLAMVLGAKLAPPEHHRTATRMSVLVLQDHGPSLLSRKEWTDLLLLSLSIECIEIKLVVDDVAECLVQPWSAPPAKESDGPPPLEDAEDDGPPPLEEDDGEDDGGGTAVAGRPRAAAPARDGRRDVAQHLEEWLQRLNEAASSLVLIVSHIGGALEEGLDWTWNTSLWLRGNVHDTCTMLVDWMELVSGSALGAGLPKASSSRADIARSSLVRPFVDVAVWTVSELLKEDEGCCEERLQSLVKMVVKWKDCPNPLRRDALRSDGSGSTLGRFGAAWGELALEGDCPWSCEDCVEGPGCLWLPVRHLGALGEWEEVSSVLAGEHVDSVLLGSALPLLRAVCIRVQLARTSELDKAEHATGLLVEAVQRVRHARLIATGRTGDYQDVADMWIEGLSVLSKLLRLVSGSGWAWRLGFEWLGAGAAMDVSRGWETAAEVLIKLLSYDCREDGSVRPVQEAAQELLSEQMPEHLRAALHGLIFRGGDMMMLQLSKSCSDNGVPDVFASLLAATVG